MRLKTFVGRDTSQAMARLRAHLGDDAVIVATHQQKDGSVRITGAVENDDLDVGALLTPAPTSACDQRLAAMATYHELPEDLGRRLCATQGGAGDVDPVAVLSHALHEQFRFAPLPVPTDRPLLLTGPPGGGKTASVAKLAARAVLEGRQVAVVTADTARAGGLEQLSALLAPLGLSPQPASRPPELKKILAEIAADTVLIDSPGLNPFKPADIGTLTALIEASAAEPLLVLAAGLGAADCTEIGHTYAALGSRRLLVTKLDAARRLGGVLAAADAGLAFCDAGIGPTIGQGLSPLSAGGLARLLLRREEHAMRSGEQRSRPPARPSENGA